MLELDKQLRHEGMLGCPLSTPGSAPVLFRGTQDYTSSFSLLGSSSIQSNSYGNDGSFTSTRLESHSSQLSRSSGMPRSLSLNLRSTLEAVPASPGSTPQSPPDLSPSSALAKLSFSSSLAEDGFPIFHGQGRLPSTPVTPPPSSPLFFAHRPSYPNIPASCVRPSSPTTAAVRNTNSPVFSFKKNVSSSSSSTSSETFNAFYSNKEISCRSSDSKNDNNKRNSSEFSSSSETIISSSNAGNNFFSSATISLGGEENIPTKRRSSDAEGRKMSVCVIEVNHEPSPVTYVRSSSTEPMIVRETEVFATPCVETKNEGESSKRQQSPPEEKSKREIIVPIRVTSNEKNNNKNEERPNALKLSVPNFNQPIQPKASPVTSIGGEGNISPSSPLEAATAGTNLAAMPVSPANNPELNSFNTESIVDSSSQRLPRCYSSSETHLNTRRLLEHRAATGNDYTTRKSSSTDEVGRGWTHHPPPPIHTQPPSQLMGSRDGMCPGELARCDSWSTSGLGSEISDWESLQDDAHSIHNEDAVGPFDAVFSDVFPGADSNDIPLNQQIGNYKEFQQRHSSYRENQNNNNAPRTPRPASLPGVMGTYLAHLDVSIFFNSSSL